MKIWQKFNPLIISDLYVALENDFAPEKVLKLDPRYKACGMLYENTFNGKLVRKTYEPSETVKIIDGSLAIFFNPIIKPAPRYRRLMFFRDPVSKNWLVAARKGEESVFGFDAKNSRHKDYLPIAYPGINEEDEGRFRPLYFKEEMSLYIKVWARDEGEQIIIQASAIEEREAPDHLILASPAAVTAI